MLDLTRILAGPYCTMVLAELGARVIKIENPDGGDDARAFGPFLEAQEGGLRKSAYFMSLNRGKESIALDLKAGEDRLIFEQLLEKADILVENFRPGTLDRLGYGWETLHPLYPRLIYAAASGFGRSGPEAGKAAYDMVVQAMGGLMSITGPVGGPPVRVGTSIGDITAGLFTTIGISTALYEREKTGLGQLIDVAMLDCQIAILENAIARLEATGETPEPLGARHPSITPFAAFKTKDQIIVIAAGNNRLFQNLCVVLGRNDLASDPRFETNEKRSDHADRLGAEIESALLCRSAADWLTELENAGVPSGPLNSVKEALAQPQILARNMVVTTEDQDVGILRMAGNPIKQSNHPDETWRKPAPDLDQDREKILRDFGIASTRH